MKKLIVLFCLFFALKIGDNMVKNKEPKDFTGDRWERDHAIWNGLFDKIQYSGNITLDFQKFLFTQGGGKSDDPHDSAAKNPPPFPDKDGKYYHTVNDITWTTFGGLSKKLGYDGRVESFYNMKEEVRLQIVEYFRTRAQHTKSDLVNTFLAKVMWGSGKYMPLIERFEKNNGCIHAFLYNNGEYETFRALIEERHEQMKTFKTWRVHGRGWTSGLAHFHRVFKWYAS